MPMRRQPSACEYAPARSSPQRLARHYLQAAVLERQVHPHEAATVGLPHRDGGLQSLEGVVAGALGRVAVLERRDDVVDDSQAHPLHVRGPRELVHDRVPAGPHPRPPVLDGRERLGCHARQLPGLGVVGSADPAVLPYHVEVPRRSAGLHAPDEGANAVVEHEVTVAHYVAVALRCLVRLHLAEDPLDVAARQESHGVEKVASVRRQAARGVGRDLENIAYVAIVDDVPGLAVERVPAPGAVHRQRHALFLADPDHLVCLGEADRDGLLRPDGLYPSAGDLLDNVGTYARGSADRNYVRLLPVEHFLVVRVEVVVGQPPSFAEDRALLLVDVGPGNQLRPLRVDIGRAMTIRKEQRPASGHLVVEGAPHAAQSDDRRAIAGHSGLLLCWCGLCCTSTAVRAQ